MVQHKTFPAKSSCKEWIIERKNYGYHSAVWHDLGAVSPEVEADGYALFLQAIPFNLYALLTLTMLITLAILKFDFGPMRGYEYLAEEKGDIYSGKPVKVKYVSKNVAK